MISFIQNLLLKIGKIIACCFSPLIFSIDGFSQKNDTTRHIVEDGWIENMSDKLDVKLAVNNSFENFSVHANQNFDLYPNTSTLATIFVDYRIISVFYSYSPKFIPGNDDDSIKGSTKGFGYGIAFTLKKWYTELSYGRTKGYYLRNTKDFVPGWTDGDPYIQFPDLKSTNIEGVTGYNFNSKYSRAAVSSQTSRQLKSAGSFTPNLIYRYYIVDNQDQATTTQKSKNLEMVLNAAYNYTCVLKNKFYLAGSFATGAGFINTKLYTRFPNNTEITKSSSPVFRWEGRAGLGYNSYKFFAGAYFKASDIQYKQENTTVVNGNIRAAYQVFVGYRFEAPRFFNKAYDKIF